MAGMKTFGACNKYLSDACGRTVFLVAPPALDDDFGPERVEDLAIGQFSPEPSVEFLDEVFLSRRARCDVQRF
jgi:hypothetical protein